MATAESAAVGAERRVQIDRMTEHDLLEVCEIEAASELSAWGWDAYHCELQSAPDTVMLVARVDSVFHGVGIAGFIVARLIASELHVNNVAVRAEFRSAGLGSALLETTLRRARRQGATLAHLEVRASNEPAQRLYRRCGFEVTGRRKKYYRDPVEDALLMSLTLSD